MIIADTSILSTFARIQQLDLLFAVTEAESLRLPPAVQKEIRLGLQKGRNFLQPIIEALTVAAQFQSVDLTAEEKRLIPALPKALNAAKKKALLFA